MLNRAVTERVPLRESDDENLLRRAELKRKAGQLEEEIRHHIEPLLTRLRERTWQLETANREHEAFSLFVAKDLRTPLREIAHH